jgi:hypothetical protein
MTRSPNRRLTISPLSVGAKEDFMTVSVTGAIAEGWSYYD